MTIEQLEKLKADLASQDGVIGHDVQALIRAVEVLLDSEIERQRDVGKKRLPSRDYTRT